MLLFTDSDALVPVPASEVDDNEVDVVVVVVVVVVVGDAVDDEVMLGLEADFETLFKFNPPNCTVISRLFTTCRLGFEFEFKFECET